MNLIIKRYQNRKLYSVHHSCYVTLEELAQFIREQNTITVIDNRTKDDISYQVYLQIILAQERKKVHDVELLIKVICSEDSTFTGYIKNNITE